MRYIIDYTLNGKRATVSIQSNDAQAAYDAAKAAWDNYGWLDGQSDAVTMHSPEPTPDNGTDDHAQRMQRLSDGVHLAMATESALALI